MKQWIYLLLSFLFSSQATACSKKRMPEGKLKSYEFVEQGTVAEPNLSVSLQLQDDGKAVLSYTQYWLEIDVKQKVPAATLDTVRALIDKHKMYQYKESYRPMIGLEIMDGTTWSFVAVFDNGEKLHSYGDNSYPKGNGLKAVNDYLYSLVKDKKKDK